MRGYLLDTNVLSEFSRRGVPDRRVKSWGRWAALSARAHGKGMQPSVIDGLIAATALEHDLTLVTRNVKDFEQLGVEIFNPWAS